MNALRRMLMPGPEGCPKGLASLEVRTQAVRANHDTCPLYPQREDRAAGTAISSDPHDTSSRSLWLPVRRGGKRRPQRCLSVKDTESDITVTSFCKQAFLHCRTRLWWAVPHGPCTQEEHTATCPLGQAGLEDTLSSLPSLSLLLMSPPNRADGALFPDARPTTLGWLWKAPHFCSNTHQLLDQQGNASSSFVFPTKSVSPCHRERSKYLITYLKN
uniref:Uncharacterized protein LOC105066271 isoform X3 n=1 Tax=Camelus bactrianus TaxID=9837 RepID=A0A9W3G0K6_CAMBA|nr:uncharacterized protein LOC105066271 isoform X3 [Camelus bactrianus]